MIPDKNIARFEAQADMKGVIQITHGFGEHKMSYAGFAEYFNRHGYACVSYDQRGHGELPEKDLGIVERYDDFLDDVKTVHDKITQWYPGKPVILYGHSMGGNIALSYLLRRSDKDFSKAVIETPWLRLHENKPLPVVLIARLLGFLSPHFTTNSDLVMEALSRDPAKAEFLKNDKLYHNRMSLRMFTQVTNAGEYIMLNAQRLQLPVLLLSGADDRIVCPKAARELAGKAGDSIVFHEEPEARHVLHDEIEPTKSEILKRMLDFCSGI